MALEERFGPTVILCPSRLEGIAQEVELDLLVLPAPIVIFAVNDPGLRWMKLQSALRQPIPDGLQHRPRLSLTSAVDQVIISISLEWDARMIPTHPFIERMVKKQIRQQRAADATLRCAFCPLLLGPIRPLHWARAHLHVGPRSGSKQAPPELIPDQRLESGFGDVPMLEFGHFRPPPRPPGSGLRLPASGTADHE